MQTALQHEQALEAAIEARYQYRTTDELWDAYQVAMSESDAYSREYDLARYNHDAAAAAAAADRWNAASDEANAIHYALSVR